MLLDEGLQGEEVLSVALGDLGHLLQVSVQLRNPTLRLAGRTELELAR